MNARRLYKRAAMVTALVLGLSVSLVLAMLSSSTLELSPGGVHRRLIVPFIGKGAISLPIYSGTGERVNVAGFLDGPVVRRRDDGSWQARWFCEANVHQAEGRGDAVEIDCAGQRHRFPVTPVAIPEPIAAMPERVVTISDLEGNARFLDAALRKLGVMDAQNAWSFGNGHLVVLGDSVDRGRDVFAVLWRLYALSAQAAASGGAVHVLLGNHEQYVLRGNLSRAHPEHLYALKQMGGYTEAFAADTVIGGWLRQQPVIVKLGDTVFVHGGVSPRLVTAGLSAETINAASVAYWTQPTPDATNRVALEAVFGMEGVTQYRGYLMALDEIYPLATEKEVEAALTHLAAARIVVAHTLVPRVEQHYGGRVYAVDVNDDSAAAEVLMFVDGAPQVFNLDEPRRIKVDEPVASRDFSLFTATDRQILSDMYGQIRQFSALPHPY